MSHGAELLGPAVVFKLSEKHYGMDALTDSDAVTLRNHSSLTSCLHRKCVLCCQDDCIQVTEQLFLFIPSGLTVI